MRNSVINNLKNIMKAHRELVETLPEEALQKKLSIPSNSIGLQFWCIAGARESYSKAISEGKWVGFNCSLTSEDIYSKERLAGALERIENNTIDILESVNWTEEREKYLLDLLEHEVQHQGQLIRYVYGLKYDFPDSWKKRWSL